MSADSLDDTFSIFNNGKLKPGIHKIQNLYSQTYVDIHEHSRDLCCRPAATLGEGRGLKWEIKPLGAGYSVQRVDPGKPGQFCGPLHGLGDGDWPSLGVTPYPMAWRLAIAEDKEHRGFEYVRFYWETTDMVWDLSGGSDKDGTQVLICEDKPPHGSWRIWKLLPVKVEGAFAPSQSLSETLGLGSLPSYDGDATGQSSTHTQHVESKDDEFGTIVNEVTVVTSTVTTRKRYRVEGA